MTHARGAGLNYYGAATEEFKALQLTGAQRHLLAVLRGFGGAAVLIPQSLCNWRLARADDAGTWYVHTAQTVEALTQGGLVAMREGPPRSVTLTDAYWAVHTGMEAERAAWLARWQERVQAQQAAMHHPATPRV
ncbi:hypothetical protein [Streptomyces longisporoflavus]|uniref:Uncharacterized protein n=1 Tax=Streptomyces longisporoflavus TaxID=28044 RepID=A0ABW7R3G3_9ACTN